MTDYLNDISFTFANIQKKGMKNEKVFHKTVKGSGPDRLSLALSLCLFIGSGGYAGDDGSNGTAPAVDLSFVVAPFDIEGQPESVFIAWRDDEGIHSGLLRLDDESFNEFPTQPVSHAANLSVGVGGPLDERRCYVVWVGRQMELMLLVFDADGAIVSSPQPVASAVQVVPVKIAGTDSGALITYAWDGNPYWDPRILSVDKDGMVLGEQVAEEVVFPEQTIGVSVSATPEGAHGVVYIVTDTHSARIRRYDATVPVDPTPIEFMEDIRGDYLPFTVLFSPADGSPFLLLALPYRSPNLSSDLRFAHTTLGPGEVILGPALSELVADFPGNATDMAGLAGSPEHAVILWQKIKRQENCECSVPPPIRIEFFAQVIRVGNPPEAIGDPLTVYLWEKGDAIGPPLTRPMLAQSPRTPGQFTVFWSDSLLRYVTLNVPLTVAVGSTPAAPPQVMALYPSYPNPFWSAATSRLVADAAPRGAGNPNTTIRYTLPNAGMVRLRIFDTQGRHVATLIEEMQAPGDYSVIWDGRDHSGSRLASGNYFARLQVGAQVQTQKVMLLK